MLYVALRTAYSVFYGAFAVTPEDVGLGEAQILVQSAAGVIVVALVVAGITLIVALQYWLLVWYSAVSLRRIDPSLVKLIGQLRFRWRHLFIRSADLIAVRGDISDDLLGSLPVDGLRSISNYELFSLKLDLLTARIGRLFGPAMAVFQGSAVVVLTFILLVALADSDASTVKTGSAQRHLVLGSEVVPWGADRVDIAVAPDKGFVVDDKECYMYLGQADGTTVLYAVRSKETIRIPSADVVVETTAAQTC